MKLIYPLILFMILGGCSSTTLIDVIEENGYENVEILFQDDNEKVVIFLHRNYLGQSLLSLNTFTLKNSRYKYESNGEYAQGIDLSSKHVILSVSSVGNSSFSALWGWVFSYPDASIVEYSFEDQNGKIICSSSVNLTKNNILYEKLPQNVYERIDILHYKIMDNEGKVIVEK
ncbi:hypothetical protein [Lederbergia citrea]|uniref:hypothetical protein n=1 Tax=Lederbergia citrea TaxID=2833581 RepID=UPI001BC8E6B8|nr:hypothetical protein [Lederbergia citrea]MBS4177001.1 hypothetical protein [Lederbergia citrea]MBS4203574.1 hypothetical protein [Lederbergia citrea]